MKIELCPVTGLKLVEYCHGGASYCENCKPARAKAIPLAHDEWFVCAVCSFAVNLVNQPKPDAAFKIIRL